jgi:hypothetical protein
MYGEVKPWGCKWFQLWRKHIDSAVALEQRLQVFYFEGEHTLLARLSILITCLLTTRRASGSR